MRKNNVINNQSVSLQLMNNRILRMVKFKQWEMLEPLLCISEYKKGQFLAHQGRLNIEQYFIIDGILKKTVANNDGKEITIGFAAKDDSEGAYVSWKTRSPYPYSICAVTRARVAALPVQQWITFIEQHPQIKSYFEQEVIQKMNEELARLVELHYLDAPSRVQQLIHNQSDLLKKIPQKELAAHLNITAETLCRLKSRAKKSILPLIMSNIDLPARYI